MKKIISRIYIFLTIVILLFLSLLSYLGSKERVGFLNLNIDINSTALSNNIINSNKYVREDELLDNIITNDSITNYIYSFRVQYFNKFFRNSDIYDVYPNTNNIQINNSYITNIIFNEKGSPFGSFVSYKKIDTNKIENIHYTLKLKIKFIITIVLSLFLTYIFFLYFNKIKTFIIKNEVLRSKDFIIKFCNYLLLIFIFLIVLLNILSTIKGVGKISNFYIIYDTPVGYVYRANFISKGILSKNIFFNYSNSPLEIKVKPKEIKNYGYYLEITNANSYIGSNKNNIGDVFNNYSIYTSKEEVYNVSIIAKTIFGTNTENIYYFLDRVNMRGIITNINTNYNIYNSTNYIKVSCDIFNDWNPLSFIFPRENIDIKSIKIEEISQKLYIKNNGNCILTSEYILPKDYSINGVSYKLEVSYNIYLVFFIYLLFYFSIICILNRDIINNYITQKYYIAFIIIIGLLIFIFQFWLGFPGIYFGDQMYIFRESLLGSYANLNPIFLPASLNFLYKIFGFHIYYPFLVNIFVFDLGVMLLIISLYYKYNNKLFILLYLINFSLIKNLFLTNFIQYKDFLMGRLVFLLYSMIFFKIITNIKNKLFNIVFYIIMFIVLIFALLSRHNTIVTIYPIFIFFAYNIFYKFNINFIKKVFLFLFFMIINAIILICIVKFTPFLYKNNGKITKFASNHIFLHQISACAVMANDPSMIPEDYYVNDKNFEDVIQLYKTQPYNADYFGHWLYKIESPYRYTVELKDLKKVWFKYITKYPLFYLKHIIRFTFKQWFFNYDYLFNKYDIQKYSLFDNIQLENLFNVFPKSELKITFSKLKNYIYSILYNYCTLEINYGIMIVLSFIIFIISLFYILRINEINTILIFTFSTAFSSVATAIIVGVFTPVIDPRYIFPVLPITIITLISFIVFLYDKILKKNDPKI